MAGKKDVEILNNGLLMEISKIIKGVTPAQFSVFLGYEPAEGDQAQSMAFVQLSPKSAYESLLHKFVNEYGTDDTSALKLRLVLLKNKMVRCAKLIEEELVKKGIAVPSHAEAVIGQALSLPSPPTDPPGSETPVAPTPSEPNRQTRQPHGQPPDHPVQQPPSISRGMQIFTGVFVAIIAMIVYYFL
eukprot:XP_011674538.1 PREDICTED: uncharacterized protein LOC105443264 [Strongylocentrotus purpuratus]